MPCSVKVFLFALIIDFIIDGFIISCGGIVISIALLPHEFVHVLGDVVFLVNCGLGKTQAIIIRLLCQLATPLFGCIVKLSQKYFEDTLEQMHTYGHGVIAGMFIYILLIDILPMIEEGHLESHQHHPHLGPKRTHSSSDESQNEKLDEADMENNKDELTFCDKLSPKITLTFCFAVCFLTTAMLINGKESLQHRLNKWFLFS